ncbi:metal dependent phosphohydrolase [Caldicellulosiruptor hydrothermalis 108]|uniref:Metal dependent phosphohydrolase n=1 Tax=Caldicellulosiruptor hydrothermalis (strain DSM 18901 / VKM B-2411 / 108) TaxID=632292 RepID=E4Q7F6_CALH1|nr:HD domain-containing phosphohydrolase [Caldicellulosiruptor hydrothermalis]ADQ07801.1 metal dependent phosphohydrolase [Caldicellulosiruptor hydrothermalis 108]
MDKNVMWAFFSLPNSVMTHSINVAKLCQKFAEPFDLDRRLLFTCGLFHDIGKLYIDERILNKRSCLTKTEFEIMKQHTQYGYDLLKESNVNELVCLSALYHHERLNGTGYWKKKKDELPIVVQIVAVVDVFEATTSYRPYRFPKSKKAALRILKDTELFNKEIVSVLESIV